MFEETVIRLIEGAALCVLDEAGLARLADRGFDCGEWSDSLSRGEEEADAVLSASGYWSECELADYDDLP